MCGEQSTWMAAKSEELGSSPRVRGTVIEKTSTGKYRGIIPACAGNSMPVLIDNNRSWDHPRVCGEQVTVEWLEACLRGSSPRVRGTGLVTNDYIYHSGIIPACAGNSKG